MTAKLTYHDDQIIYVIYIKIFYGVTIVKIPTMFKIQNKNHTTQYTYEFR